MEKKREFVIAPIVISNYHEVRSDSQSSGQTGASWQMSNGRTIVYKQDSLLQVPEDPQVKKRQRDLTESRRKVPYMPPALRYYDSATPAWVRCRVVISQSLHAFHEHFLTNTAWQSLIPHYIL